MSEKLIISELPLPQERDTMCKLFTQDSSAKNLAGCDNNPKTIEKESSKDLSKKTMITSYSMIIYSYIKIEDKHSKKIVPQYLLAQRRDSIPYVEFLRGRLPVSDIPRYIELMTTDEIRRILKYKYSFMTLWKDLWVNRRKLFRIEFSKASQIFASNISEFIPYFEKVNTERKGVLNNEWLFPKGRKNQLETEIQCALREFEEETKISSSKIKTMNLLSPYEEIYTGHDGKTYRTVYYMGLIDNISLPSASNSSSELTQNVHNSNRFSVSEEISRLKWVTLEESRHLLSDAKIDILETIDSSLQKNLLFYTK